MIETLIIALVLVLFRVAAFVAFLPPVAGNGLPSTVKVGMAVALTMVWGPMHAPMIAAGLIAQGGLGVAWPMLAWLSVRETLFGIALAWLLGLLIVPVRIAGAYIGQETGLTMATLTSPTDHQNTNIIAQGLEALAILMFFAMNLHHVLFRILHASFVRFPTVGEWNLDGMEWVVGRVSNAGIAGLQIAAPVAIVLFAGLVTLLLVMRAAPQFNLFTFGMQVRLAVGLIALLLLLPDVVVAIGRSFHSLLEFSGM
ncbi:flagellar biosynthesis protein FliR [Maioricimonas rarisocia]|uniref:Flagellar biosynthesis protein FliR n=1 Tax=Maioricimonas rarisocia TaxID=2528026 RepID=A0A517ZCM4_9PLAN|nr:flagellar biosynthetic protein FliR [Maioricimonas rarisocia]QDU40246.1 flagellar biosynthesis protein FliR [Maioricimonas rarisocia]